MEKEGEDENPNMGSSGFAYGRHEESPDSEENEPTRTKGSQAKLSERGANPRQSPLLRIKNPLSKDNGFLCYKNLKLPIIKIIIYALKFVLYFC